jgi:hypothetical protein
LSHTTQNSETTNIDQPTNTADKSDLKVVVCDGVKGSESSGSINGGELLDQMSDYSRIKMTLLQGVR